MSRGQLILSAHAPLILMAIRKDHYHAMVPNSAFK